MNLFDKLKRITLYFFFAFFIFGSVYMYSVLAENTQQYNKIYLNPFYRASMVSNTNYTYDITIKPEDKVGNIVNAMINFQVYISPSVVYTLLVNDKFCNNPSYTISTTYASAGLGFISFDCSNVINKEGNYKLTLRADKNSGSSFGWLDLTYSSNVKGDLTLHGTEYISGQTAKAWLQLRDINGTAIEYGICYVDIYTPNGTDYIEKATMNNLNHDGIYYYDIDTTTLSEGVYPIIARCYYVAIQEPNFATSYNIINGSYDSGLLTDTYIQDTNYFTTSETPVAGGNPRRYDFNFNFENKSCNVSESLLNGITIKWVGRWNSIAADDMSIHIYNHTSSSWILLPNYIEGSGVGVKVVSNSISSNNLTRDGLVNLSGSNLKIKFNDTYNSDATSNGFDYDLLSVYCDGYLYPTWQQVSGSSEMHISTGNTINENINDLKGENMALGLIVLFIADCIALVYNMSSYKKPVLHLVISLIFFGLVMMFNNAEMEFMGMICFIMFIVGIITWIVLVRDGRSNTSGI